MPQYAPVSKVIGVTGATGANGLSGVITAQNAAVVTAVAAATGATGYVAATGISISPASFTYDSGSGLLAMIQTVTYQTYM